MLSVLTSWESCGHPKSLGNTPLLKNLLTGVIQRLLAIPPESSCYLKNLCGCIQESISRAGMGGMTGTLKFKAFFQKTHFVVYFKHDVPSWKSYFPRTLLLTQRGGGEGQSDTSRCKLWELLSTFLVCPKEKHFCLEAL